MADKKEVRDLKIEVAVKIVTAKELYGELKDLAVCKIEKTLSSNSDTKKRVLLNELEDVIDQAQRSIADTVHFSKHLTDGELKKAEDTEENPF